MTNACSDYADFGRRWHVGRIRVDGRIFIRHHRASRTAGPSGRDAISDTDAANVQTPLTRVTKNVL